MSSMINQSQDGKTSISVFIQNDEVIVNGEAFKKPGTGNASSIVNGEVYINGYALKNGKFKRSLLAVWYNYVSR